MMKMIIANIGPIMILLVMTKELLEVWEKEFLKAETTYSYEQHKLDKSTM